MLWLHKAIFLVVCSVNNLDLDIQDHIHYSFGVIRNARVETEVFYRKVEEAQRSRSVHILQAPKKKDHVHRVFRISNQHQLTTSGNQALDLPILE